MTKHILTWRKMPRRGFVPTQWIGQMPDGKDFAGVSMYRQGRGHPVIDWRMWRIGVGYATHHETLAAAKAAAEILAREKMHEQLQSQ